MVVLTLKQKVAVAVEVEKKVQFMVIIAAKLKLPLALTKHANGYTAQLSRRTPKAITRPLRSDATLVMVVSTSETMLQQHIQQKTVILVTKKDMRKTAKFVKTKISTIMKKI